MEIQQALEALEVSYETLKTKKREKREMDAMLKEAMRAHLGHFKAEGELLEAKAKMNTIKIEAMESAGLTTDLANVKSDISVEKDVINNLVSFLISEGAMKHGEEMQLGNIKVTPKITASLKSKQMSMFS